MRLLSVVTVALLLESWTAQTAITDERPFSDGYYQPINKRQTSSGSEDKNINDLVPSHLSATHGLANPQRALEARAALPMPPVPPRTSFSDGYYQPITCSSRFGSIIHVLDCLNLIYHPVLEAMDHLHFIHNEHGTGTEADIHLPCLIQGPDVDSPYVLITSDIVPGHSLSTDRSQNIQNLMYRMMLQCVIYGGGLGAQASLLSGVTVTLKGIITLDDEQSDSGIEDSEPGDPADRFAVFVPGAQAHWVSSYQELMPLHN